MAHRRHPPKIARIVEYWRTHPQPWMKGCVIGWSVPFCFGCGWIPPVQTHKGFKWEGVTRFLDRAHLQDHHFHGNDKPSNMVFLCPLCHSQMPSFQSRKKALQWVAQRYTHRVQTPITALHDVSWQMYTDSHLCLDRDNFRQQYELFLTSIMIQAQASLP